MVDWLKKLKKGVLSIYLSEHQTIEIKSTLSVFNYLLQPFSEKQSAKKSFYFSLSASVDLYYFDSFKIIMFFSIKISS